MDLLDYRMIILNGSKRVCNDLEKMRIPTLLGSGIRLFENVKYEIKLRLLNTQSYNCMIDLIYTRR